MTGSRCEGSLCQSSFKLTCPAPQFVPPLFLRATVSLRGTRIALGTQTCPAPPTKNLWRGNWGALGVDDVLTCVDDTTQEDIERLGYTFDNGATCEGRYDRPTDPDTFGQRWTAETTTVHHIHSKPHP